MSLADKLRARVLAKTVGKADNSLATSAVVFDAAKTEASGPLYNEGSLQEKLFKLKAQRDPKRYSEIERITGLPIRDSIDAQELEAFCKMHETVDTFESGWRFFDVQAAAILTYQETGGLFAPIGVGWGKTIVTIVCAQKAWEKRLKRSILFIPPNVYPQFWGRDLPQARKRLGITVPFLGIGRKNARDRMVLAKSGKKGCYVVPYSMLSTKDSADLIDAIQPDLIIADEAHYLKSRRAARTRRLLEFMEKKQPEMIALSGTITNKSILDYWHLLKHCLKEKMPLPNQMMMAADWAQVLDSQAAPSAGQTGPLRPLIDWAIRHFPELDITDDVAGFRRSYRARLVTAPGVVATSDQEIGTSLVMTNEPAVFDPINHPADAKVAELIEGVQERWLTPNGDEIDYAIHCYKWLFEITSGFYNQLTWPTEEEFATRRDISFPEAKSILQRAKEHLALENDFNRDLRAFLNDRPPRGVDTPLLVGADISKHGAKNVGRVLADKWKAKQDADFEGRPDRDQSTVRVSPYKINQCVEWVKKRCIEYGRGGIVWYYHHEMGAWTSEILDALGFPVLYCPAGRAFDEKIIDLSSKDFIVVASISAHGTGKNLQHFQEQFFLQWPRSAKVAEQTLGRLHRNGQEADELEAFTCNTLLWDKMNFAATLVDALYVQQSTGNRQKLIYANYDPLPDIFPPEVLRERGFQNQLLSSDQRKVFMERFTEGAEKANEG